MVKQGTGVTIADIVTETLRNRSTQLATNITRNNALLDRMSRTSELERFNVLMKLAAGEVVEVPWNMIKDDDRIRLLVNKLVRAHQLQYSISRNSVVPVGRPK
jgi:hypothetical protein